jgi:branched chain amino acid efflux pump
MPGDGAVLLAILGMAIVTYLTRVGGLWLMSRVPLDPRAASFLRHLSSCVLVALVVPGLATGDFAARLGVAVSLIAMVWSRNGLLAMACGVVTSAGLRAMGTP